MPEQLVEKFLPGSVATSNSRPSKNSEMQPQWCWLAKLGISQHGNPAVRHRCTHTTYKLLISQTLRNPSQLTLQKSLIILFQVPSSCSSMDTSMANATAATVCSCARSRTFVVEILPDCTKVCFAYSRGFTPHAGLPDSLSPCTSGGGFHIIRRTPISDFADDDSNCTTSH